MGIAGCLILDLARRWMGPLAFAFVFGGVCLLEEELIPEVASGACLLMAGYLFVLPRQYPLDDGISHENVDFLLKKCLTTDQSRSAQG